VDRALVEHAEDDVDRNQRSEDQDRRAGERILKRLGAALEARRNRSRQMQLLRGLLDRRHRLANRDLGRQVEAQRHRRELALVVDRNRCHRRGDRRELAQRHFGAARRGRVDAAERVRPELEIGLDFEDYEILVESRVDARRDPLSERVIEDRIDNRRVDAELRGKLAVDLDLHDPAGALLVTGDVGQLRRCLQFL